MLIKLGAAGKEAGPAAWRIIDLCLPDKDQTVAPETFCSRLNWQNLREARRREGSYLLRSNLTGGDPAQLWAFYLQLTEVEQAFKELRHDLAIRPIYQQTDERIEAHIFIAFLAYCLQATLKQRLRSRAPGLTPRSVLDKMAGSRWSMSICRPRMAALLFCHATPTRAGPGAAGFPAKHV